MQLTPIILTVLVVGGLYLMSRINPTYKKKDLYVFNELTQSTTIVTVTPDTEQQLRRVLSDACLSVVDEEITER